MLPLLDSSALPKTVAFLNQFEPYNQRVRYLLSLLRSIVKSPVLFVPFERARCYWLRYCHHRKFRELPSGLILYFWY